jgi:hypothetical protein
MRRRWKQAGMVFIVVFAVAQLIRPGRTNPPIDASRTIQAHLGTTSNALVAVLDRSCRDCHSNQTEWRWYTRIAPVSWLMAYGVNEGRRAVNFSEWSGYSPDRQRALLAASCSDTAAGRMPGAYAWIRPDTRLSARDIDVICAAAR